MTDRGNRPPLGSYPTDELNAMLIDDNRRMREAGGRLAEAAMQVATEYDGVHRLMLAASAWCKAVADEGGRGERHAPTQQEPRHE